jgi:hypothetical protein
VEIDLAVLRMFRYPRGFDVFIKRLRGVAEDIEKSANRGILSIEATVVSGVLGIDPAGYGEPLQSADKLNGQRDPYNRFISRRTFFAITSDFSS